MPTLATAFDPKSNAIGFMRLVCASAVIAGHAITLGGYSQDVLQRITNNQMASGRWPVDVFFVLSGFLLTDSIERVTLIDYARNRALRIYPAFLVCIALTTFTIPAIFGAGPAWAYLLRSAPLVFGTAATIPGLFGNNVSHMVNGALWTLPIELYCYMGLAALKASGLLTRRYLPGVLAVLMALFIWTIATSGVDGENPVSSPFRLGTFFFAGSCAWLFRGRIAISGALAALAAAFLLAAVVLGRAVFHHPGGLYYVLAPIPFSYLALFCAVRLPFTRINTTTDISYGIYIYGTPVIQVFAALGAAAGHLPYAVNFAAVAGITFSTALASWHWIEKPAMRLKRRSIHPVAQDAGKKEAPAVS